MSLRRPAVRPLDRWHGLHPPSWKAGGTVATAPSSPVRRLLALAGGAALTAGFLVAGSAPALAAPGSGPTAVVSLGDSAMSGEGAGSYEPGTDGPRDYCHRSVYSTIQSTAVAGVERKINIACSGAASSDVRIGGTSHFTEPAQADQLRAIARDYDVKMIVLQIGANDVGQGYALDRAPHRLQDLTARICARRPGVELLVASVLPIAGLEPQVESYNAWLPGVVAGLQQDGCAARFVDRHAAVAVADLFDGVHPRRDAYARMARVWADEVAAVARRGPTPAAPGAVNDDALTYAGYWARDERPGAHRTDAHSSANTGDTAELGFAGSVVLRGTRGPGGGIAAVSVDGGPETLVDYYAPVEEDQAVVYRGPPPDGAWHVLRLRVVGRSGPRSTGTAVSVDRVDVVR